MTDVACIPNKSVVLIQVEGGIFTLLEIGLPAVVPAP